MTHVVHSAKVSTSLCPSPRGLSFEVFDAGIQPTYCLDAVSGHMEGDKLQCAPGDITRLLDAWHRGDEEARDLLMPIVYGELRRRSPAELRRESGRTLRPTELVHETYLRLCAQNAGWKNRGQFFAVAARLMRRIIVDHARARRALKRGRALQVTLVEGLVASRPANFDLIEVDRALQDLSLLDERLGRLVEMRFFGGLTSEEAAHALGISLSTVNREWAHAKAWLFRRLKRTSAPADGPRS